MGLQGNKMKELKFIGSSGEEFSCGQVDPETVIIWPVQKIYSLTGHAYAFTITRSAGTSAYSSSSESVAHTVRGNAIAGVDRLV